MSSAAIQKGTTYQIAFGDFAYTGYVPEDGLSWSKPREVVEVTDTNGAIVNKVIHAPKDVFSATFLILDAGSITPPNTGDTVSITDPANTSQSCMCVSGNVEFNRAHTKLVLELVNEPDITYS